MDIATVSLFSLPDSVFIKAEFTNSEGRFEFPDISPGTYYLHVAFLGYHPYITKAFTVHEGEPESHFPSIVLTPDALALSEVTVLAEKPFVERKSDRLVVNVSNSIIASGLNALELLARAPGVVVSASDAVSIRGRAGVIFMIDGKVTPMTGQELANYLRSLPAESIDRIEIITNPSAKYDAAGNAGIIDIRMKKDSRLGTNGTVLANFRQGVYAKAGLGVSLNHRNKKLNVFGGYNFNFGEQYNDLRLYRAFYENEMPTGAYRQKNYLVTSFDYHTIRAGMDYTLSPHTIIGILANGSFNTFQPTGENYSLVENGQQEVISSFTTENESDDFRPSYSFNTNVRHTFPTGNKELSLDIDLARYRTDTDQEFITRYFNLDGEEYLPYYLLLGDLTGELSIRAAKVDYVHPFSKDRRIEAGLKTSFVQSDNNLAFIDASDPDHPVLDSTISNHFLYDELINAAYVNFSTSWTKFSLQAGLRVEQTVAEGTQLFNGVTFDRNYTNLFPSIFLNYTFTDRYTMGLNMSRRLDRPSYQQLNPFKFYLDPTTYREGNPYLNPQFTWSFEWNHTFLQRYTATLSYAKTTDNITQVIGPAEGEERVTVQTNRNLNEADYISLSVNVPVSIGKWWNSSNAFTCYYGNYQGTYADTELDNGNVVFDINSNNTFTLGNDWSAELNFFFHSREQYAFMNLDPRWGLSAGIQKQFSDKRSTLKLSFTDIFWTSLPAAIITYTNYVETFDVYRDTRLATLSYTHRFGNSQVAPSRRRAGGATEEKQRAASGSQG